MQRSRLPYVLTCLSTVPDFGLSQGEVLDRAGCYAAKIRSYRTFRLSETFETSYPKLPLNIPEQQSPQQILTSTNFSNEREERVVNQHN